jgi:hypothetical protein
MPLQWSGIFIEDLITKSGLNMFGLFKKKNKRRVRDIEDWELFLLYNTLAKLPEEYHFLQEQIEQEIFAYATVNSSTFDPDFIGFGYSSSINQFENRKLRDYNITNIKVHDIDNSVNLAYRIGVASGVIAGYSLTGSTKPVVVDISDIDVGSFKKQYFENPDFENIKGIFTEQELSLINQSEVYKVPLDGKDYYHIQALENGDFIGIDSNKTIYQITHDPYEIVPLPGTLETVLNEAK